MPKIQVTPGILDLIILGRFRDKTDAAIAQGLTETLKRNVSRSHVQGVRQSEAYQKRVSDIHACLEHILALGKE